MKDLPLEKGKWASCFARVAQVRFVVTPLALLARESVADNTPTAGGQFAGLEIAGLQHQETAGLDRLYCKCR